MEKEESPASSNGDTKVAVDDANADLPKSEPTGGFGDFLRIFSFADKLSWLLNSIAFIAAIGAGSTLPLMTIIFGNSIAEFNNFSAGSASAERFKAQIYDYVLIYVYLFIARLVLSYVSTLAISIAAIRTTRALRQKFLQHMLRKEVWHFDKKESGSVAVLVTTNGARINKGIADQLVILVQSSAMFFAAFIVALAVQWKLALITMTIIPAIFIFTAICIWADSIIESRIMRIYSKGGTLVEETISSIRTVHAFWAQSKMTDRYDNMLQQAHDEGKKKSVVYGILFSTEYFCVYSGLALAYWQGYRMFASGEVPDVGKVFTVIFSVLIGATAVSTIAPQFPQFTNAAAAASEIFELLDSPSQLDPLSEDGEKPANCRGSIEIRDLTFSYPSRPSVQVLNSLNLSVPAGKTTALVGASGWGKSTLVGLLERWYERQSGSIELDGLDITKYNTKWLRTQIGLVQQEPVLFGGTILQNVANGLREDQRNLSKEEQFVLIQEACRISNSHDFITALPDGYNTEVGQRADLLSGGQRQRVAIARSIISNPRILLLDEATSALDPKAEGEVQRALDRVARDRTTLVIAHKLATIKNADNIAVISAGVVVEQGTHNELLAADGHYARLVAAQDIGHGDEDSDAENIGVKEDVKEEVLERQASLFRPKSRVADEEALDETTGTMGYGLIKCIYIMLAEQKHLYVYFAISTVACAVAAATFPGQALLYSRVIQAFTLEGEEGRKQANFYSLMFFVVALGNLVAYFVIGITCNIIGQDITHRYRHEMFKNILRQDMAFFNLPGNTSGALTSKLSSMPTQLQDLISANLLLIFVVFLNVVSSSVLAIIFGWKLGLVVVFGGLPPLLLSGYARIRIETALEAKMSDRFAESAGLASEAVMAIKTVSSLTLESTIINQYNDMLGSIVQTSARALLFTLFWYAISQSLEFLILALGFWYGGQLVASGEYTLNQFFVIFIGVLFAGQAAAQFFGYTTSITKATGAANYILWLRSLKPVMLEDDSNRTSGPGSDGGEISMDALEFRYPGRNQRVLKNIDMTIPTGQFVAFVGPSGCGKSTMISLLERFYDPTSGTLNFNKRPVKEYSPRLYRQHISLVQQEPTLYSGSILENIAMGLETPATEAQVRKACHAANAQEFIDSLPEGLATPCGSRGLQFSGGQKQRLAIARALIREPKLLLLDEATSALDTQSERIVQAALDRAKEGRTTVAVAHRLSTVKHADRIFVFGDGRVVECGTHSELVATRGRYYEMCLAQSLDREV